MPAIWLIWFMFPFAPESAIMKTEFWPRRPFLDVLGQLVAGRVPDQLELAQALLLGHQSAPVLPLDLLRPLVGVVKQTFASDSTSPRRRRRCSCRRGSRTRTRPS